MSSFVTSSDHLCVCSWVLTRTEVFITLFVTIQFLTCIFVHIVWIPLGYAMFSSYRTMVFSHDFSLEWQCWVMFSCRYFSYEHFYVIYCKFWELDTDHDFLIDKENLIRYGNHSLTYRIVDRIFTQVSLPSLHLEHSPCLLKCYPLRPYMGYFSVT